MHDEDRIRLTQELCETGRFGEAHALLDDVWVMRAGSLGYLLRAYVYALQGQHARSREAVDWALLLREGDPVDVLCLAGHVLLSLGDEHRAVSIAQQATAAAPDDWRPRVLLADAYRDLDRIAESVAAARRAVALAPHEADTHLALARSLTLRPRGNHDERQRAWAAAEQLGADVGEAAGAADAASARIAWWRRLRWLPGVLIFVVLQALAAVDWRLAVALIGVLVTALAVLWMLGARRTGVRLGDRVQAARTASRAELAADPGGERYALLTAVVGLPVVPFATTGFLTAAAADGAPWSADRAVLAALAVGAVLCGMAALVRWWHGEDFLRRVVLRSPLTEVRLVAVLLLSGGAIGLSLAGVGTGVWWDALFFAHLGWFVVGLALTGRLLVRERRR